MNRAKAGFCKRILFVDDEESMTSLMNSMLEVLGYQVTCHADASTAYEDFSSQPEGYSLVICDQVMPGMTGLELAGRVKQASPQTPVILCAGYVPETLKQEALSLSVAAVMEKPFALSNLALEIRKAMEPSPAVSCTARAG